MQCLDLLLGTLTSVKSGDTARVNGFALSKPKTAMKIEFGADGPRCVGSCGCYATQRSLLGYGAI